MFLSNVDTSGDEAGKVFYRQTTDSNLRRQALIHIQRAYPDISDIDYLVIATWDHVGYYPMKVSEVSQWSYVDLRIQEHRLQTNTFQCVMAVSGNQTFVIYLYADGLMQWSRDGDTIVGYNAGDGGLTFYRIPGSLSKDIIKIVNRTNVGYPGLWVFRVDQSKSVEISCADNSQGIIYIVVIVCA